MDNRKCDKVCVCPDLGNDVWAYYRPDKPDAEPNDEIRDQFRGALSLIVQRKGEGKLPQDFTPIPFVAMTSARLRGVCPRYKPKATNR